MKEFILLLLIAPYVASLSESESKLNFESGISGSPFYYYPQTCQDQRDVTFEYVDSIYEFATKSYKAIGKRSNFQFVYSPVAMWMILASIAEGADQVHQQQIFRYLGLPDDICIRQQYYKLATTRISPGYDVNVVNIRTFVIDENLKINSQWYNFVRNNYLLDVVSAPIRSNPEVAIKEMNRVLGANRQDYNLIGNSVILDTVDYNGLWATAFSDATIERAPFYNQAGVKIGSVDLMKLKRRARIAYLQKHSLKALELPIGVGNRYRLLIGMVVENKDVQPVIDLIQKSIVFEFLNTIEESHAPLEVAIPRFTLSSELNARVILEDMGITSPWTDEGATRFISAPPALPSSFIQRVTMTLSNEGLAPPELNHAPLDDAPTGINPILGRNFTANRPFMFAIVDAETYTILMASVYTQPTYAD